MPIVVEFPINANQGLKTNNQMLMYFAENQIISTLKNSLIA
jgi:hypothetical protein